MGKNTTIVVCDSDRDRAALIAESLQAADSFEVHVLTAAKELADNIREISPDVVLIDVSDPSRDTLEELALASGPQERAVAMFVDRSDAEMTRMAIEAGVSAYVVDGMQPERIKPILDAAISRFNLVSRMRAELEATRRALEERKLIDRAKGMIMKARGIEEEEAYALLRKTAMDQGKRVAEVAQALVTAAGLLG